MAVAKQSFHDAISPDASADTRYPLGDKSVVSPASLGINTAAFTAAAINLIAEPLGTAISVNYRTFLTGTSAATAVLSVNSTLGPLGAWSISTDSLVNSGTALGNGSLQVTATDGVNTVSFPVQPWSINSIIVPAGQIKWNPGHYKWTGPDGDVNSWKADILSLDPIMTGEQLFIPWAQLEGNQGDYTSGFNLVSTLLGAAHGVGKKLTIYPQEREFGAGIPNSTGDSTVPTYIAAIPNGVFAWPGPGNTPWSGGLRLVANLANPAVMNPYIALGQAYFHQFQNDPAFAAWGTQETASGAPSWDGAGYNTQLLRWMTATRAAGPTMMLHINANFIQNNSFFDTMYAQAKQLKIAIGGPDPELPNSGPPFTRPITANTYFRGEAGARVDYRGQIAWIGSQQQLGFDVAHGSQTVAQSNDYQTRVMQMSYMYWIGFTVGSNTYAQTVAFLQGIGGAVGRATRPAGW